VDKQLSSVNKIHRKIEAQGPSRKPYRPERELIDTPGYGHQSSQSVTRLPAPIFPFHLERVFKTYKKSVHRKIN
jgi:hypothetical protein